jgi:tetratricopeptide (TPR) repeat protein/transcriptional regulator with XRE-family HTH domain
VGYRDVELAGLILAARLRTGLTQEELAERAAVSTRTVRNIESGAVRPRMHTVRLLAAALRADESETARMMAAAVVGVTGPDHDTAPEPPTRTVPAQLPPDVLGFVGRHAELRALDDLSRSAPGNSALLISAISGTAGVGKTALAVHWAQQVRDRFPDGQMYVDLHGYDPDKPMPAAEALTRLLSALGVPAQQIPLDVEEQIARYRTALTGRRMLVLLDNAATADQVRPLLPGTSSCVVLVTSRDSLPGLVAFHGARRLEIDLLPPADALALLHELMGDRVAAEPDSAAALAAQCARLPLALRVAAELAVARPGSSVAELVDELADQQRRLSLLDAGGDPRTAVPAVFSWSLRQLPADTARVFRLLGLHPGEADGYAAAAVADTTLADARRHLDRLARAHLVHATAAGGYGMHDLLRAYAVGLIDQSTPDARVALDRLFDYYLAGTAAAMDCLYPAETHRRPRVPAAATPMPDLAGPATARRWLDRERSNLVAAAGYASDHGRPEFTVRLSSILFRYLDGGHHVDALAIHGHARDAALKADDPAGEAQAANSLGTVHMRLGQHRLAVECFEQALARFRVDGDQMGQARALSNLGNVEQRLGHYRPARDHIEQALAMFRRVGDRFGEVGALHSLGGVEQRAGRYRQAYDHLERALTRSRLIGDQTGVARALVSLGIVEQRLGRLAPAAEHIQEALVVVRQLGNRSAEARALESLGTVYTRLDQPRRAAELHRDALVAFRECGELEGEPWALNGLGEAALAEGCPADAVIHHRAALAVATATGARDQQARAHAGLGYARRALGDTTQSREDLKRALALYTALGSADADAVRGELAAVSPPDR